MYKYKNEVYKQKEGGAIGLRITGSICRIVMDRWKKKTKKMMEEKGMKIYLMEKFVDDVNVVVEGMRLGSRWNDEEKRIEWSEEEERKDKEEGRKKGSVTMEVVRRMAGEEYECVKFTAECEEDNEEGRVPMLDLYVWKGKDEDGDETIKYSYYEKKVTSNKVIMKRSAISEKTKKTVLSQEVIRRMKNNDVRVEKEEKVKIRS